MNLFPSLLFAVILVFLSSSCSRFVSQDLIETRLSSVPNPYNLDIYYGEDEIPYAYEVTGYFEWRRVEGFTHRKNIGRKMLKKTNRYIGSGKLPKPDGVIINDFLHATYIKYSGEKKTAVIISGNNDDSESVEDQPKKVVDYSSEFLSPNAPAAPKLRIGGGLAIFDQKYSSAFIGLNLKGNYWLGNNSAISVELTPYLPNSRIFRLHASVNYQRYFNFKELKIAPIELSVYPYGGITLGLNRYSYLTPSSDGKKGETFILSNFNLGVGTEYRLSNSLSAYLELGGMFSSPQKKRIHDQLLLWEEASTIG